jgi:hypothetical protein
MSDHDVSEMKKIFSYTEAAALLPEIKRQTQAAFERVEALKIGLDGSRAAETRHEIDQIITEWAQAILDQGIDVKGLWLVDFDNGSGYYCWRHPEPGLHFFHSYEDGFRGRIPIQ